MLLLELYRSLVGLDVVVNNDGAPPVGLIESFDDQAWRQAVDRNLMSVVWMVRAALPHLRKSAAGSIVNITSLSVLQPVARYGLSVSTWAAVVALAKTMSIEFGIDGIRVNTVCPGRINTGRVEFVARQLAEDTAESAEDLIQRLKGDIPLGRFGEPSEVAAVVAFLASPQSSYLTGATLHVDGGTGSNLI